ncbi:MAG: hypothetical protein MZU91_04650 [Desulfosudis oleivorans]|nr:hypothetical protein [Desulfosudis oleivorans]
MVAPQKLWEESRKVLGKVAEAYGEMAPVPESCISFSNRIDLGAVSCRSHRDAGPCGAPRLVPGGGHSLCR